MDKKSVSESGAGAEPTSDNTKTTIESTQTTTLTQAATSAQTAESAQPVVTVAEVPGAPAPETMPATDAATGAPVDAVVIVKPPKKKKTGLIIGIIVAILLVLSGIGFGIWYFAIYQNPENVVFDAVNNLITAKNVSPTGTFTITIPASDGYQVDLNITAESSSRRLPNETSIKLMLGVRDASGNDMMDEAIEVDVGSIQMSDGVAYLKLDHLSETLDQILPNVFPATDCAPTVTDCLPNENPIENALYEVADLLDGEWWQISLPDILDEIDELEDWQAEAVEEFYACALNAMNADNSSEVATLYARNRFIDVEEIAAVDVYPQGTTGYSVSLNYDALANFLNASKHVSTATTFYDCYNAAIDKAASRADSYYYDDEDFEEMKISPDDIKDVTASDLRKIFPADAEIILFVEPWGHALREVSIRFGEVEEPSASIMLGFGYDAKTVDAPESYRSITELFDEIGEIIYELSYDGSEPDFSCDEDDPGLCYNGDFTFPLEIGI